MPGNKGSVNAQAPLTVVNARGPDLPVPGGGAWKYGVFGILLRPAAVGLIVHAIRRKKPDKQ